MKVGLLFFDKTHIKIIYYCDNNNNLFRITKNENIYIWFSYDQTHINTNHDNINFWFLLIK